jgi:hypothetical protein
MGTLQEALEAALPILRAEAEARMTSRCTVRRKNGTPAQNESTGLVGATWTDVHTDLPFRLVPKGGRSVEVGGVEYSEATARGDMPWDTTDLRDGDYIEITSGEWAETVISVVEAVKGDQRTARRVPVVEVARPVEWD